MILWYLKGTIKYGLFYKKEEKSNLIDFNDNIYTWDQDDRRSTNVYVFMLGSGGISWYSKKQSVVILSIMKTKFMVVTLYTCQAIWLKKNLEKLISRDNGEVIVCDNNLTIKLFKNLVLHGRNKHIVVKSLTS